MDLFELMEARHSVRNYLDKPIEKEKRKQLDDFCKDLSKKSGLTIKIVYDEPKCFNSLLAHYGKFSGVTNYAVISGKKSSDLEEMTGYFGEQLVLKVQEMGMNTCWVVMTHGKVHTTIPKGEKISVIISLGYGSTQGHPHPGRPKEEVCPTYNELSDLYKKGVDACYIAPTAINQKKFLIYVKDSKPYVKCLKGFHERMDIGIIKYHFEAITKEKLIEE